MKILRTLGKGFGGFIFTTALIALVATMAFVQLTNYDTLKPIFTNLTEQQFTQQMNQTEFEQQIEQSKPLLAAQCQETGAETIEVPLGEFNVTLNCSTVQTLTPSSFAKATGTSMIDRIYYKEWNCSFIDCLKQAKGEEAPFLLFSAKANSFFSSIIIYLWIAVALGIILLIVSIRNIAGILKSIGISMIVTGIPYFVMGYATTALVPPQAAAMASSMIALVTNLFAPKFLLIFEIGIALTVAGFVIGYVMKRFKKEKEKK